MAFRWIPSNTHEGMPMDAVIAGRDCDGSSIYVGRSYHNGDMIPCKIVANRHEAYVPYDGREVQVSNYEVLCGNGLTWVSSSNGHVPPDAVCAGNQCDAEPLYIGRAHVEGSLTVGKVHPSHRTCYVPFGGAEHSFHQYEVLVCVRRATWERSSVNESLPHGAVNAGYDVDHSPMYVGRAWHAGDQLPAKVLPTKRAAYVAHGGQEVFVSNYEVLCNGNTSWVFAHASSRSVPPFAVSGGQTSDGEPLYIGRAHHCGSHTIGKYHVSHGALYIPYDGAEVPIHNEIEILVEH